MAKNKLMKFYVLLPSCLILTLAISMGWLKPLTTHESTNRLPDHLLVTLRLEHPRLLAHADDFALLRTRVETDPTLRAWHKKLLEKGDKIIAAAPSTYQLSDRENMLEVSRQVVKRIYILGLLYQLHNDKKYSARAWQELNSAAGFPNWNPQHFLDVAEMTHAFAIGYDWFYPAWTRQQREEIKGAIINKGLKEAVLAYQDKAQYKRTWWTDSKNNWNIVCNSGVGIGALAIADESPKLAEYVLHKVVSALPIAMKEYGPDGAWKEGPSYWDYATRYNVIFIACLKSALGSYYNLDQIKGFSATALLPIYLNGPFNLAFNFGDASDEAMDGPQLFWLAKRFDIPLAAQYQKKMIRTPQPLDLLWFPTNIVKQTNESLPLAAYFRSAEIITMRSAWNDKDAWFVGIKGGDNQTNHSHLDLGTFILDAYQKRWAVDLGRGSYKMPGYFNAGKDGTRWTYYSTRAEGHNTLVLNPSTEPDQNPLADAKMLKFKTNEHSSFAILDLTPAYAKNAVSVRRGIALVNPNTVVLQDEISTDKPADFYWFMHTPADIAIKKNGRSAILSIDDAQIEARIISPALAQFHVLPAAPLPTSPKAEGKTLKEDIKKLVVHLQHLQKERVIVTFQPVARQDKNALTFTKPLREW